MGNTRAIRCTLMKNTPDTPYLSGTIPSNVISACIPGLPEQTWLRTITDLLLILALAGLTYIALNNYPGFWPGWLQTVAGAGFAIAAGYLAIRYYTLFIFLYLLGLCLVAGTSAVAFFWWIL